MKHLLSREDFVKSKLNEGRIGDTFRKGINKIKGFFSLMIKKVKNFIALFDNNGNVLPVVPLQAVIDHYSNSNSVDVYSSKDMSDSVIEAGGNGCKSNPSLRDNNESYDYVDNKSIEFKNFMNLTKVLRENLGIDIDMEQINERISYSKPGEKLNIPVIDSKEFESLLEERIFEKQGMYDDDDDDDDDLGNLLIFGAPGIGKSSIANTVIKKYNQNKSASESISMITVNCANLEPGDFMMPTIPMKKDIYDYIERNKDIPEFSNIDNLSDEEKKELQNALKQQKVSDTAPKSWLPCYKPTGNPDIDAVLNAAANGAITKNKKNARKNKETGSGGILLFDELFRARPSIFDQLMTFLLTREFDGWQLGSKWAIVACSNRPADSKRVSETWQDIEGADLDRYCQIALLKPSVEGWKEYMRNLGLTGENEILFKFIFDPDSKDGDEYTRWHRVDNKEDLDSDTSSGNEKSDANTIPVTPRRWEKVWKAIKNFMKRNGFKNILEIPINKLNDVVKSYFTPDFLHEFIDWFEAHTGNVDLHDIIEDPTNVFPRKDGRTDDAIIIRDLWEQFEKMYKKKKDVPDEELANIFIWLGIHMSEQVNLVKNDFFEKLDTILENQSDNALYTKEKSLDVLCAAWPSQEDFEKINATTDDRIEEIKNLMKEYFPWRLKGDEILWVDKYKD